VQRWLTFSLLLQIFKYTTCFGQTGHLHVYNLFSHFGSFKATATAASSFLVWHCTAVHIFSMYCSICSNFHRYVDVKQCTVCSSWACGSHMRTDSLMCGVSVLAWRSQMRTDSLMCGVSVLAWRRRMRTDSPMCGVSVLAWRSHMRTDSLMCGVPVLAWRSRMRTDGHMCGFCQGLWREGFTLTMCANWYAVLTSIWKIYGNVVNEFFCLSTAGKLLWTLQWKFGFYSNRKIFWIAERLLARQKEVCCIDSFSYLLRFLAIADKEKVLFRKFRRIVWRH
jgi:hypothetical protein